MLSRRTDSVDLTLLIVVSVCCSCLVLVLGSSVFIGSDSAILYVISCALYISIFQVLGHPRPNKDLRKQCPKYAVAGGGGLVFVNCIRIHGYGLGP